MLTGEHFASAGIGAAPFIVTWTVKVVRAYVKSNRAAIAEEQTVETKMTGMRDRLNEEMQRVLDITEKDRNNLMSKVGELRGEVNAYKSHFDDCVKERAAIINIKDELARQKNEADAHIKRQAETIGNMEIRLAAAERANGIRHSGKRRGQS